jgi:hypothetical protein
MSEPTSTPPAAAAAFDPQRRRLCPDGSCVGLVGPDGRCRVCGLFSSDGPGDAAGFSPEQTDGDVAPEADAGFVPQADGDESGFDAGFDAGRGLCPDGSCVGVLGADGRCKVCGRRADAGAGGTGA